jgi:hypothetical protein
LAEFIVRSRRRPRGRSAAGQRHGKPSNPLPRPLLMFEPRRWRWRWLLWLLLALLLLALLLGLLRGCAPSLSLPGLLVFWIKPRSPLNLWLRTRPPAPMTWRSGVRNRRWRSRYPALWKGQPRTRILRWIQRCPRCLPTHLTER